MATPAVTTTRLPRACFAPPLTDELLARYEALAVELPDERGELRDALRECLAAVKLWWSLPESTRTDGDRFRTLHRGKQVALQETPLTAELIQQLWDVTPWPNEIKGMQAVFDAIPPAEKELRDAAFHLLWHVIELASDREPFTADKLPA